MLVLLTSNPIGSVDLKMLKELSTPPASSTTIEILLFSAGEERKVSLPVTSMVSNGI